MPAPEVPNIATGNADFSAKMRAFHQWEANELWAAVTAFFDSRSLSFSATSNSSVAITAGNKSLTIDTGKGFQPGQFILLSNTPTPGNYISGQVVTYNSGTGALVMTNVSSGGSGTFTAWTITLGLTGGGATLGTNTFSGVQNFFQGADVASASTVNLTSATGNNVKVTGNTQINTVSLSNGAFRMVFFSGTPLLAYNATTNNLNSGGANYQVVAGDRCLYWADNGVVYGMIFPASGQPVVNNVLRNYLSGLTMSTAGSSATMTIAAGQASDSANVITIGLAASIAKTTSAWAVGTTNGGLDTGTIANSTWYHFYLIRRPDTGVVDVLISLSATSPTLPANYTQFRRIGSGRTNGSAQWVKFIQVGDYFDWDVTVLDVNAANPGTAAVTRTLTVPTGVQVIAIFNGGLKNASTGVSPICYFSPLDVSDESPSETAQPLGSSGADVSTAAGGSRFSVTLQQCRTNTSAQIRTRLNASDANITHYVATKGWVDLRGKD